MAAARRPIIASVRALGAVVTSALLLLSGCSDGDTPVASIDGGTPDVTLLGDTIVAVSPGQTVLVEHVGAAPEDDEAPVTHALVTPAPDGSLPPIFMRRRGGVAPNPGVWGACRGGSPARANSGCPIPAVEGPERWDGQAYWSTGALVRGGSTEIPLHADIPPGDHVLVCALHPGLRVVVRVDAAAPEPEERDVEAEVAAARAFALEPDPHAGPTQVSAGVTAATAYVAGFAPPELRISQGTTVTWRAAARTPVDIVFGADDLEAFALAHAQPRDGLPHGDASAWDGRGVLQSGFLSADPAAGATATTWSATFTRPGTYRYASRFSPSFEGTVIVE